MAWQSDTLPEIVPDLKDSDMPHIDFYSSIQERLKRVGEEFSTYAQSYWGKVAANFLDSTPGHEQMEHDSWEPVRILGAGGFGLVGLWQKVDWDGAVQDEIAIKEMKASIYGQCSVSNRSAREAIIMKQLNDAERNVNPGATNILRLRGYKNFLTAQRWRLYLEYAPYGDLHSLIYCYKAWDVYLPEEFLWHVFYALAKVTALMKEGPFTDFETEKPTNWSVVHFDIKPANVYMGKCDEKADFPNYPTIKLADFGLAQLSGQDDGRNPSSFRMGTPAFEPPVRNLCWYLSHSSPPGG